MSMASASKITAKDPSAACKMSAPGAKSPAGPAAKKHVHWEQLFCRSESPSPSRSSESLRRVHTPGELAGLNERHMPAKTAKRNVVASYRSSHFPRRSSELEESTRRRPLSMLRSQFNDLVFIDVGPERAHFAVPRNVLCSHSKYFEAEFSASQVQRTNDLILHLPNESPATFDIVNIWLQSGQLTVSNEGMDEACSQNNLIDLFIFGEKFEMPKLCNDAIDGMIKRFESSTRDALVTKYLARAYRNTNPGSPLRQLIIATYMRNSKKLDHFCGSHADDLMACPEFLLDLAIAREGSGIYEKHAGGLRRNPEYLLDLAIAGEAKRKKPSVNRISEPCKYHRHAEDERRCAPRYTPPIEKHCEVDRIEKAGDGNKKNYHNQNRHNTNAAKKSQNVNAPNASVNNREPHIFPKVVRVHRDDVPKAGGVPRDVVMVPMDDDGGCCCVLM
ncbi:hypothetical protein ACLMJK_007309 [Lecanora helva]